MNIKEVAEKIHENAKNKGFWEKEPNFMEKLMLIVTEVGECADAYREDDKENIKEELADIVIRVFDTAEGYGINIEEEILKKMKINEKRPYKHGNKKC